MKLLKKISVATLLFSLLLALAVPVQAKAEDSSISGFYYDSEERVLYYSDKFSVALPDEACALIDSGYSINAYVIRSGSSINSDYYCRFFFLPASYSLGIIKNNDSLPGSGKIFLLLNGSPVSELNDSIYGLCYILKSDCISVYQNFYNNAFHSSLNGIKSKEENYFYEFIYSDLPVYKCIYENSSFINTNELFYGVIDIYTFEEWCSDAGLSCSASSNEVASVVPFFYEPDNYNYIVRKNLSASSTSGVYQLTMLQKTDGAHYPYYFEVNNLGYLGVAGSFTDTSAFTIRNFYYDTDGNGWKHIERFDVCTLPFDNTNVNFSDNEVLVYSDADIFSDRQASSVWQHASTEYFNVDIQEPEVPTPTPEISGSGNGRPGSGSRPDVGGQATAGGGLDFIINLWTLIWTKICSVPMNVDGYSISLQQIFVYDILVGVVGGFILSFIFRRR